MTIGVYWIYQVSRDRAVYVGSSGNVERRTWWHANALKRGKHPNKHLQSTWDKYGADDFKLSLLETCSTEQMIEREEFWMFAMPAPPTCNAKMYGSATVHNDATRLKISLANKGNPSPNKGKSPSAETRRKISEAMKGRPKTDSEMRKRREPNRHLSEEHRRKLSEATKGRPAHNRGKPVSEETRQKVSKALKGRPLSEENKRNISKALTGKTLSKETRRKISETLKRRHEKSDD